MAASAKGKVLARRPSSQSFKLEDLMDHVQDGRLRVPKFQRDLKWGVKDVAQLFDSIYRGYPIGTLLLWVRRGEAQRIEYGTVAIDAPAMDEAWWVVDGQQRVNALVRALTGAGVPREDFALYFDLDNEAFIHPRARAKIDENWLPLTEVVDSERLMDWLLEHPGADRTRALAVGKRIREYSIPAYLVTTDDEDAVREIFRRMNDTGKRMEPHEVFTALYGAQHNTTPADVREVAANLCDLKFGVLEHEQLHSMMLATRGIDISKQRVPEWSGAEARAALVDLDRAARSVVVFLRDHARIPHVALLPYALPLTVLTRFFHFFPQPHSRNLELLSRWVWRGALGGRHAGNITHLRAALTTISGESDEHQAVQNLLDMVADWRDTDEWRARQRLDGFRFRDARAKLQTLVLWSLRPRHLQDGQVIEIEGDGQALFPPASVSKTLSDGLLANRMIHPPLVSGSLTSALLATTDDGVLASHAMDQSMLAALRSGDLEQFRQQREARLLELMDGLFELRAQPDASDRPPLAALMIDDEGSLARAR